jgi:hypothetical protein
MPRVKIDLRDVRGSNIEDPRVLLRFVNVASGHAIAFDVKLAGAALVIAAPLATGSTYRVEVTPSRYSSALRMVAAVKDDLEVKATLIRRAAEWAPAFTPWASLGTTFTALQKVLAASPNLRVGRVTPPVLFTDAKYDGVALDDESRVLAKTSLLNMYGLLSSEERPGTAGGHWFDGITELFLATRERIIGRLDESDAKLIERIDRGAHGARYKSAPAVKHIDNFREIPGFEFDSKKLFSIKSRDKFGNIQMTVARGSLGGKAAVLIDADCDENGVVFAHLLDLPKHAVTGGTNPFEIHEILVHRDPVRDLGYLLAPRLAAAAAFAGV